MEELQKKRVKDSETEQSYLLMHRHINGYGRLFGGQLVASGLMSSPGWWDAATAATKLPPRASTI